MNNILVIPKSVSHIKELLDKDIYGFIIPIKDYSIGYSFYLTIDELESLLKEVNNKKIIVSLNKIMHNSDLEGLNNIIDRIKDLNVDRILYYDHSIYNIAKRYNLLDKLVIYEDHLNTSILSHEFYKDIGISCSYISNDITMNEINEIKDKTNMTLYMTVYGYLPIFLSRRYLLTNYLEYINEDKNDDIHYIMDDKNEYYPIYEEEYGTTIYTKEIVNLLNKIDELRIDYLVLNSFNIEESTFNSMLDKFINKEHIYDEYIGFLEEETIYKVKGNGGDDNA